MKENQLKSYKNILPILALLAFLYVGFLIVKPFIIAVLTASLLAYIFHPFYKIVKKILKNETISALIVTILIILLVTIPLLVIINAAATQIIKVVTTKITVPCEEETFVCDAVNLFYSFSSNPETRELMQQVLKDSSASLMGFTSSAISSILISLPNIIASIFVMILVIFYALKDGAKALELIQKNHLPFNEKQSEKLAQRVKDVTYGIVYGYILVAITVGIVGGIGFYIFGVENPVFWGFVLLIFSILPLVGPPAVWLPMGIYKITEAISLGEPITRGVGLLLYGLIVISGLEYLLNAKITGQVGKVHPVVVLIGALGGLKLMGFIGVVIGPLILALLIAIFEMLEETQ